MKLKLKNKHVLVYGLGDSGRSAIKLLKNLGAHISFYDDDVRFFDYIGFERNPKKNWDLVVVSPGIKCLGNTLLSWFEQQKIPVISEIDLAYLNSKGKIIAVTGTNGKTTVCMLTNVILKVAGYTTFLCGNVGLPFSSICEKTTKDSVVVCEVSNFQLETSKYFRADINAILNVKPDHLDRHGSFKEYLDVKSKIASKLKRHDLLILNLDDDVAKKLVLHKKVKYFSKNILKRGTYIYKNQIFNNRRKIIDLSDISLIGEKNLENVLASVALTSPFKIDKESYFTAIKNFIPAHHRMEKIGTVFGVTFIDDSKATNVASTIACVDAFKNEKIILLMGGQSKEIDYDDFFKIGYEIKMVVCFGAEAENIMKSAQKFGYNTEEFSKFEMAVKFSMKEAEKGDYVLLSPACSSFDEFQSYAERGDAFKKIVLGNFFDTGVEVK